MNRLLNCFLFLIALLAQVERPRLFAQEPTTGANATIEKTHEELRALRDGLLNAVRQRDKNAILKSLHPEVVLTMQAGDQLVAVRKQSEVADYLDRMLTGPNAGVKELNVNLVVDEQTILHGEGTGIAYGSSTDSYVLQDGKKFTLPTRWTATLIKDSGEWKLASLQVGSNLFQNPVIEAYHSMLPWVTGISLAVGGLLCWVVGRVMRKANPPHSG